MLGHRMPAGVVVERDYDPGTPRIEAIPGELNQVWNDLDERAGRHGRDPGRCGCRPGPSATASWSRSPDTGGWASPAAKDHAFEPFFTTKPVGEGTGLGLAISKSALRGIGGKLEFESEPGRTVARVWLPGRPGTA